MMFNTSLGDRKSGARSRRLVANGPKISISLAIWFQIIGETDAALLVSPTHGWQRSRRWSLVPAAAFLPGPKMMSRPNLSAEALRHVGAIERIYMKRSLRNGELFSVLLVLAATLILILQR